MSTRTSHAVPVSGGGAASPRAERPLRQWQRRALTRYLADRPRDFLAVATPGAGKTTFALKVAGELLGDRSVDTVTIVCPTEHLKHQWSEAATAAGLAIDPEFSNAVGRTSVDFQGVAVTYAQVAAHPVLHMNRTEGRRTLVIFDEIHHTGDAKSWGEATREAFAGAARRLALTGTPFRSDDNPIPFVTYEPDSAGALRSRPDHSYGYADALADGVVRPVVFLAYSGQASWRTSAGEEMSARLGEPLTAEHTARAWKTALDPKGDWMPAVLQAADTRVTQLRAGGVPDAGGLVIATDHTTAKAYAKLLRGVTGEDPVVVLSDDPKASGRIAEFSRTNDRWMVAVRMVSEGVDVPRLAVGVYATSASTPLFFAQAVGRFVRSRRPGETASVFLPSVPSLLGLASELEVQRDHVLGEPHRPKEGWDDELVERANRTEDEPGEERGFESLSAEAELDQLIYDGSSFGTAAGAGSAEEQDYLGLPGLLEPDQVRALLRRRQSEQLDQAGVQAAEATQATHATPATPAAGAGPARTREFDTRSPGQAERLKNLRRELNALVAAHHHRTNKPHGVIHGDLRRTCGGPATPMASEEQIEERIATLRSWR